MYIWAYVSEISLTGMQNYGVDFRISDREQLSWYGFRSSYIDHQFIAFRFVAILSPSDFYPRKSGPIQTSENKIRNARCMPQ